MVTFGQVQNHSLDGSAEAAAAKRQAHAEWRERIDQQDVEWAERDAARRTDGAATATLVLGILGFVFGPAALVAFITSYFATRNGSRTAGLVCAWIAAILTSAAVAYLIYVANHVGSLSQYGYSTD